TELEEADLIASGIERAVGGTSLYSLDAGRSDGVSDDPLAFHDIAVLFRTSAQGDAIALALDREGIPYQRVGVDPLTNHPFVPEILSSLEDMLKHTRDGGPLASDVGRRPIAEIIERLDPTGRMDPRRRSAADLLATIAVPFGTDLSGFLAAMAQMHENDLDLEPQRVALLTLHASKGLEFSLVFIAGCEDGLVPFRSPGRAKVDAEEERRLLYVGMTRARRKLILTLATERTRHGRVSQNGPCPFLSGVSPELFQEMKAPHRKRGARQLSLL